MKSFIQTTILLLGMLLPATASAIINLGYDFEVDGIYYDYGEVQGTVEVTLPPDTIKYCGDVVIPATVTHGGRTYTVIAIGSYAFDESLDLTSVIIPNSVTAIRNHAFWGCKGLRSVSIGNSVSSIGGQAFYACEKLTSVSLPNSLTRIDFCAFESCTGLTSMTIPSSVQFIGSDVFIDCTGLESLVVDSDNPIYDSRNHCNAIIFSPSSTLIAGCKNTVIPDGVTAIGYGAFSCCTGLKSINIPNSVTYIGEWAFNSCKSLEALVIPSSVTTIGRGAFANCAGLAYITVDDGNTTYDSRNHCNAIIETATGSLIAGSNNTVIPNSVSTIEDYAFSERSGLTSMNLPNGLTRIGMYAFAYSSLTSVNIPEGVTFIPEGAFLKCSNLTRVSIPSNVTWFGTYAFAYCFGLTNMVIPATVTAIGQGAFAHCSGVTDVYSYITDFSELWMGDDVFEHFENYAWRTLHVPHGMAAVYQADWNWYPHFWQIVEGLLPGDLDADARISIADVSVLIDMLLGGNVPDAPDADIDHDGNITISDATSLIDMLLTGAW